MASDLDRYDPVFEAAGREWNVDPVLLKAIAAQESGGNPRAVSKAGAQGLMQIIPGTQTQLGMKNGFDPVESIWGGAKYMAQALDAEGTPERALLYYHGGPNWAAPGRYGPESAAYVPGVRQHYVALAKAQQPAQAEPAKAQPAPAGGEAKAGQAAEDWDQFTKRVTGTDKPGDSTGPSNPQQAPPTGAAPQQAKTWDQFKTELGATQPPQPAEAPAAPETPQLMRTAPMLPDVSATAGRVWSLLTPPLPDASKPANFEMPSLAPNLPSDTPGTPGPSGTISMADLRNALADPTEYTPSGILPFAVRNNPLGQPDPGLGVRLDLGPLRPLARGVLDLLEGPRTGTITPEAQSVLFGAITGGQLLPSVARGTGAGVAAAGQAAAETSAYGAPVPDLYTRNTPAPSGNALAPERAPPTIEGTATEIPQGAPQPQSGGAAATPSGQAGMMPDEILAERHRAEKDWLNRTIQPGVEDSRELVPGNNPTLAQREQNAATSREQKSLTQQNPELAQEEQELLDEHDLNRKKMYQQPDLAGSTVLLNNAAKAAKDRLDAGLSAAFANKTAADAQPVVEMADEFLAGREGKRTAIANEVQSVRSKLFDDDGKLETDPEILWGVREHINDVLSKENQRQNPVSGLAQRVLIQMRDKLDQVIDPAAPGFTAAIKGYAEEMKAPDVMEALQERENGLHDSKGRMQFSRFHNLMRDIVDARQPGAALSPFQNLTDNQMQKLMALHDDLKRAATARDLAAAHGSDTAQNLWDAAKTYAKGRGVAAINMIPYVGGLVRHGQEAYAPYAEMKAHQKAKERGIEMLRPPPDKYPTRNPLAD